MPRKKKSSNKPKADSGHWMCKECNNVYPNKQWFCTQTSYSRNSDQPIRCGGKNPKHQSFSSYFQKSKGKKRRLPKDIGDAETAIQLIERKRRRIGDGLPLENFDFQTCRGVLREFFSVEELVDIVIDFVFAEFETFADVREMARLTDSLGRTSAVSCSGTFVKPDVSISLANSNETPKVFRYILMVGSVCNDPENYVGIIRECFQQSRFGLGDKTVLDTSYRNSLSLESEYFYTSLNLIEDLDIMSTIEHAFAASSHNLIPKLYKLNFYEPGGMFRPHVDTPRASNFIGTIIVTLPCFQFTGGQVKVEEQTLETSHNDRIHWIAFYGDSAHEVLPLTSGNRLVMTYNIFSQSKTRSQETVSSITRNMENDPTMLGAQYRGVFRSLSQLLVEPSFGPHGVTLGFPCRHRYVVDTLNKNEINPEVFVKGCDGILVMALRALGLEIQVVPFAVRDRGDVAHADYGEWDYKKKRMKKPPIEYQLRDETNVIKFHADFFPNLTRTQHNQDVWYEGDYGNWWGEKQMMDHDANIIWCTRDDQTVKQAVKPILCQGNDASVDFIYVYAAILATVPSWDVRSADLLTKLREDEPAPPDYIVVD